MNILIFGSGVIGSVFGVMLSKGNHQVTMYARGNRLTELNEKGLLYSENKEIKKANVCVADHLDSDLKYDYVFVTVRYDQIEAASGEVRSISCDNIVTMVNNPNGYENWENVIGDGRVIPAFPGAGGAIVDSVLEFQITPKFIQSTIFGELGGQKTERIRILENIFKQSKIPYTISKDMDAWQKCHLALVLPLAKGIYLDGGDNFTTAKNKTAIKYMASTLKSNFYSLKKAGFKIQPRRFRLLLYMPTPVLGFVLKMIYNTTFAGTVICEHALNAKIEMDKLDKDFNKMI